MTKKFGIFAKDGLKITGSLSEDPYSVYARDVSKGYISLFFKSSSTSIILGSYVNLKPNSGERVEGFIFFGEYTPDELNSVSSFRFLQDYFSDAKTFILQSGYEFLDIYEEERITKEDFKIPNNQKAQGYAKTIGGKLLFSKESFVCSKDLINSLSIIGFLLDYIKPALHTGFTFVISQLIVPADLIICANKHPDKSKIDIDFDTNSVNILPDDDTHYKKLVDFLPKVPLKTILANKTDIVRSIVQTIIKSEPDSTKRKELDIDWTLYIFEKHIDGNKIRLNVKTAIDQLYKGSRKYFEIYVNSNQYNTQEFETVIRTNYFADDIEKIEKTAMHVDHYPSPEIKDEVLSILKKIKKEKTFVVPTISPRVKFASKGPEFEMYNSRPRDFRKVAIIVGIIILILAIIAAAVLIFNPFNMALPAIGIPGIFSTNESAQSHESTFPDFCVNKEKFQYPDCEFPTCCVLESADTKAQVQVPVQGIIDNETKLSINPESASGYDVQITYKNKKYSLQDGKAYNVHIENLQESPNGNPKLKILVTNHENYKEVFITKYRNNEWEPPKTVKPAGDGSGNVLTLDYDGKGIYGLFIENLTPIRE